MESMLAMGVFLLAVLLLDIQCAPLSWGWDPMYEAGYTEDGPSEAPGWDPMYGAGYTEDGPSEAPGWDPMYGAGYTEAGPPEAPGWDPMYGAGYTEDGPPEAPGFYEPEWQMDPGYESGPGGQDTSYQSGPGGKDTAAAESQHFTPKSPQDILWVIPPSILSGEDTGPSTSHMSHPEPSPGSQFIPGELLRIKSTMEDGAYESETQEKGARDTQDAMVNTRPPQPKATMPTGSFQQPLPYDWLFLTGQYARGTYPDVTRSVEHGRDDWQVNHYRRYDDRAEEEQQVQSFPSASMEAQKESKAADVLWPRSKGRSMMAYYW